MNRSAFPRTSFGILLGLGWLALFLAMPRPLVLIYFSLACIFLGGVIGAGLLLSQSLGLNLFVIHKDSSGSSQKKFVWLLGRAALIGVGLGALLLVVIRFILLALLPDIQARYTAEVSRAIWQRIVIAFDSAVLEEIIFRLFLFSVLIWLAGKIWHIQKPPSTQVLWAINLLIAIGFGLAHLPQWSTLTPLTPAIILTVVFLNSLGGLTFGFLYFESGLEAAMLAHFLADLVLHVIGPALL